MPVTSMRRPPRSSTPSRSATAPSEVCAGCAGLVRITVGNLAQAQAGGGPTRGAVLVAEALREPRLLLGPRGARAGDPLDRGAQGRGAGRGDGVLLQQVAHHLAEDRAAGRAAA